MRDNKLKKITSNIFNLPALQFLHEFISFQHFTGIFDEQTNVEEIIREDIWNWDN
jgi:hypothetical protein